MLIKYVNNQPPIDSMTFGRINCNLQQCVVILGKKQTTRNVEQTEATESTSRDTTWLRVHYYTITTLLFTTQEIRFTYYMCNTMFRSETSSKNLFSEHDSTSTEISYCFL